MARLKAEEIRSALKTLEGWEHEGNEIRRTFRLKDFTRAMGFVTSVALAAERMNHHPDIDIRWNIVTFSCSTHSEGGVTEKDITLAMEINKLFGEGK